MRPRPSSAARHDGRARAVGEQGGRAAVGLVDEAAQNVGADDEHVVRSGRPRPGRWRAPAPTGSRCTRRSRPWRRRSTAPRSCATSGAQFGVSSSAASVATSTRSRSSARHAGALERAAGRPRWRGPGAARPRTRTCARARPVRWTIHCSVTPAPAATVSFVTTRSGHGHGDGRQGGRAQMAVPRHGGRRHRRCGVGGGGFAHGRPRVRPQELRATHRRPPSQGTSSQGSSARGRDLSRRTRSRRARRARAPRRASGPAR